MVRDAVDRMVRVGKGAVFLVGLTVSFALMLVGVIVVANAVLGAGDGTFSFEGSDPRPRRQPRTARRAWGSPRNPWRCGGR